MALDIEMLYQRYGPMVMRRCRQILVNEESAADAMQEVFVRVLRKQESLTAEAPSSLLYTIATRVCLNYIRDQKKHPVQLDEKFACQIKSKDNPEEKVAIRDFLDYLFKEEKEDTRLIAVLRYIDGFTLEETADMVSLSVSGVRKRLRKLKEKSLILREAS